MKRLIGAVLSLIVVTALPAAADSGGANSPACTFECGQDAASVTATDDHFGVAQQRHPSDVVPGRGAASDGPAPGKRTWTQTEEYLTPACSFNGLHGADVMCMHAATYCQDGRIAFWVWHQVTTFTVTPPNPAPVKVVGPWLQEHGTFCLGADDPGVPTVGKVVSWVQDHFSTIGILPAGVSAAPAPRTLVNIETRLSAGTAAVRDLPTATPWTTVTIHAKPLRWRWTFGDGSPQLVTTTPDTTHVYRRAGKVGGVTVEVEWGGTFTLPGDPTAYPIVGTALVPGAAITVEVREARSELVSR